MKPRARRFFPRFSAGLAGAVCAAALWASAVAGTEEGPQCPDARELCLEADRAGAIDLKNGTAELEGNVRGYVKPDQLRFFARLVKAFRDEQSQWVRLVLDGAVRLSRPGQQAVADHVVLERERIRLVGNVRLESGTQLVTAGEILVEKKGGRAVILGTEDEGFLIRVRGSLLPGQDGAGEAPKTVEARAQRAVIDRRRNRIELSGAVSVVQAEPEFRVAANQVRLDFENDHDLKGFRAEGEVNIRQPGRELSSDIAISRDVAETILLVGNARVRQDDQFELTSDRIEVYADAKKGVVRSQEQGRPITLSLAPGGGKSYRFDREQFQALTRGNIPRETLNKLTPILGKTFSTPAAFENAVRGVLNPAEAEAYLETIVHQAK